MAGAYGFTQLEFDPEQDPKGYPLWLRNAVHVPRPFPPLAITQWVEAVQIGKRFAGAKVSMPQCKGLDVRIMDGYYYIAVMESKPEEVPEREKVYQKYLEPIIEDFEGAWDRLMAEWLPLVDYFKQRCHPERLKELSNAELFELLEDYQVRLHRRCWVDYFTWLYTSMDVYNTFGDLCQKLTGIDIEHPTFKKLLGGFDTVEFRINKELWRLGDRAKELGLGQLFLTTEDNEELMSKLEASDEGRKWLEEYHEFLDAYGWRCPEWNSIDTPTWIEKPSLGLRDIKSGMAKGGPFVLDAQRERLVKEREEAEKEVLAKVPGEQRDWFTKLMRMAGKSSWFQEEHAILTGLQDTAIGRHLFMEYGRRFAEAGVIDNQDDVFFLLLAEIKKAALALERTNLRPYVNKRREEWESNLKIEPPPFIGDIHLLAEQSWKDPLLRIVIGMPRVRPELKADLYGVSSVSGVVEGTARVIIDQRELSQVKPGEILVTVITNAIWTPIFGVISGVVTDMGGSLAHPAIVAREYGIPAVVGTMEATKKIKTGDKVRVDGDNCCVYVLS